MKKISLFILTVILSKQVYVFARTPILLQKKAVLVLQDLLMPITGTILQCKRFYAYK